MRLELTAAGRHSVMFGLGQGIAHVSFAGGGFFVPARSSYDRQLLADHALARVRVKRQRPSSGRWSVLAGATVPRQQHDLSPMWVSRVFRLLPLRAPSG